MRNPKDYKFVIFGRIIHGIHFVKELKRLGFPKPVVICSLDEEYLRDQRLLTQYGLWADFEALEKENICDLIKLRTINSKEALDILDRIKCNVAFSINCRDIIKNPIIDYFRGEIFNLHDSFLPNERGGALNTWRILNGIDSVGDTIHYLEEGIDSGPVIIRKETMLDKEKPFPIDYLLTEVENCKELLTTFLDIFLENKEIPSTEQNHDLSLYFPRQYTELNGLINWDWEIENVEKFIRAFSNPYPGAFSYYKGKKVNIIECIIEESSSLEFHPYCNGRILTNMKNGDVRVVAGGRSLLIKKISLDGEKITPSQLLSTKYLFQSFPSDLQTAKGLIPTTNMMAKDELCSLKEKDNN